MPGNLRYTVLKNDGNAEAMSLDKIIGRLKELFSQQRDLDTSTILSLKLAEEVMDKLFSPIKEDDLDILLARTAYELEPIDLIYGKVAATLELQRLYKNTEASFSRTMLKAAHLLNDEFVHLVEMNRRALDEMIDARRDSFLSYPALIALQDYYLLKDYDATHERPQHLWARVALQIHGADIPAVQSCYDLMSNLRFIPGTSILLNSGKRKPFLGSNFLLPLEQGAYDIFDAFAEAARLGRGGASLGFGMQGIPASRRSHSSPQSEAVTPRSGGVGPVLKVLNTAMAVLDDPYRTHPGVVTASIDVWHPDIFTFLRPKDMTAMEQTLKPKISYCLFVNDLFMRRVEEDKQWTLFCPSRAPQLINLWGDAFDQEYERLEKGGRGEFAVRARDLLELIVRSEIQSGAPSIIFKDSINAKSNESHLGTVMQANAYTDTAQYTDHDETASCSMASVILPAFVLTDQSFDFAALEDTVRFIVLSLTRAALESDYPTVTARTSAHAHRAIAIGIQGLSDAFSMMGLPYDSEDSYDLNADIAECIYYTAMEQSCELTRLYGVYPSFKGSPLSDGLIQPDYWEHPHRTDRYDWDALRDKVKRGTANALVTAYMPTIDTSVISGCSSSFEPFAGMLYHRKVDGLMVACRPLVEQLEQLGLWTEDIRQQILYNNGSIQSIDSIPRGIRELFKTVWDISPNILVAMAAARAPFVCQSQSLSLFFTDPTTSSVKSSIFHAWKTGLKSVMAKLHKRQSPPASSRSPTRPRPPVNSPDHTVVEVSDSDDEAVSKGAEHRLLGTSADPISISSDE